MNNFKVFFSFLLVLGALAWIGSQSALAGPHADEAMHHAKEGMMHLRDGYRHL